LASPHWRDTAWVPKGQNKTCAKLQFLGAFFIEIERKVSESKVLRPLPPHPTKDTESYKYGSERKA
jgi:hypothetical protein